MLGERVHAVVVPATRASAATTLRAWCAERLSDYKVPETMALTAEPLPRNANGKVMKRQLREMLGDRAAELARSTASGIPDSLHR